MSSVGKVFNEGVIELGLEVANNLVPDPTTHSDPKSGTRRALDLVITNQLSKIHNFKIDMHEEFSPFAPRYKNGIITRTYSDHRAISFDVQVGSNYHSNIETKTKTKSWMYNTKDGNLKYQILTDDMFEWLLKIVDSDMNNDQIVDLIDKNIEKIKFKCYKIKSFCNSRMDDFCLGEIWSRRLQELDKIHEELKDEREADKVFKCRDIIERRNTGDVLSSLKDHRDGRIHEDVDSIFQYLIEYNEENMRKEASNIEEVRVIQEMKDQLIDDAFDGRGNYPATIPWEVYCDVVKKVMSQNKHVFRDFCKSGPLFKLGIFAFLNKIYTSEIIPESYYQTKLTKLYKRKGDVSHIKSYRFIHNKCWGAKLLEKCVVKIMSDQINLNTPPSQIGGMPMHGTRDHIITAVVLMRMNEARGVPTIFSLIDLQACFDKVRLNDIACDMIEADVDLKALKIAHKMSDTNIISISRDPDDNRNAKISKSVGQGTSVAAKGTSLTVGKATHDAIPLENCAKINNLHINPLAFVDDLLISNAGTNEARENGRRMSRAMEVLSLTCNNVKSVMVVAGRNNKETKVVREDLEMNPVKLHGLPIGQVDKESYLGFLLSKDGADKSIELTVKNRKSRAWQRAAGIKTMINHPMMKSFGWLKGAVVLIRSILPSIISYSCEVWIGMPRKLMSEVEKSFKDMVYSILELGEKTLYSGVLLEIGAMRMKHYIHKIQLCYMNQLMWSFGGTVPNYAIWAEWQEMGDRSMIGRIDAIAMTYGLPPLSEQYLDPTFIKRAVKTMNDVECWSDVYASSMAKERQYLRVKDKRHFGWSRQKSRALLLWRLGSLRFRGVWKVYNRKHGLASKCVMPQCGYEEDCWSHMIECPFYDTKWDPKWLSGPSFESDLADFIVKISRERFIKVKHPLI